MRVLLVDDDSLVALSLKTILEASENIEIAGIGHSGEEAITLYSSLQPDILLMDIRMAGMNGLEAGEKVLKAYPDATILFLTTFSDDEYIIKALHIGAKGYILKQDFEAIAPALHAVYGGQTVFGSQVMSRIPELMQTKNLFDYTDYGLNEKEYAIMELVAKGLNNKELAEELFLSEGTVRNYLSIMLEKLNLRDRTQLAIFYYTDGRTL